MIGDMLLAAVSMLRSSPWKKGRRKVTVWVDPGADLALTLAQAEVGIQHLREEGEISPEEAIFPQALLEGEIVTLYLCQQQTENGR